MTAQSAPTPITDRPLGVVDLLDGAFHALRQRPQTLVLAVAWIAIPGALLQLVLDTEVFGTAAPSLGNGFGYGSELSGGAGDAVIIRLLLGWFITAVSGVTVSHIVGGWLIGADTKPLAGIRATVQRLPAILVVFVIGHVLVAIGFAVCGFPGLIMMALFSVASPVLALERDRGPIAALKRSAGLCRSGFSTVFGLMVSIFFTGLIMQIGLLVVSSAPGESVGRGALAFSAALSLIGQMVLLPLNGAAMALLYLDLRFRNEGLDLELRAKQAFAHG